MQRRYVINLFTIYFFVFIIIKLLNLLKVIILKLINYYNYIGIPSCFFPFSQSLPYFIFKIFCMTVWVVLGGKVNIIISCSKATLITSGQ